MFQPDHEFGAPSGPDLFAELGIDRHTVREIAEDERAIRCPERSAVYPAHGFADLVPEPALEPGLHEAAELWDPASSLPPAE